MTRLRSRFEAFTDEQWAVIEPLLPSIAGRRGQSIGENRRLVEGTVYRYRTGIAWRDLPCDQYGPWQTVWKRHRRYAADGTRDKVLAELLKHADAAGRCLSTPHSAALTSRDEHRPYRDGHRGHGRVSRICRSTAPPAHSAASVNLQVMASAAPAVG